MVIFILRIKIMIKLEVIDNSSNIELINDHYKKLRKILKIHFNFINLIIIIN